MWIDEASRIESAADRKEFVTAVIGYKGPGLGTVALAGGILAWYLLRRHGR